MTVLAKNKNALFNYNILETFEAGLVLRGHEVKSVKNGHLSLKGSFVSLRNGELYLLNSYISPYKLAGPLPDYDPNRPRKLLLKKREIKRLIGKLSEKGLTLVPVKAYTKHSKIKIEIALARGKEKADKRETIKRRETERDLKRLMRKKF